jgi:hypothetical protein
MTKLTTYTLVRTVAGVSVALFSLTACDKKADDNRMAADTGMAASTSSGTLAGDIDVEGIDLGKRVGADGKIADKTDAFNTADTVVAIVDTDDNAGGKELIARWTYGDSDQVVSEQRQTVAVGKDVYTTFRLTKETPWPTGTYHVRIMYNGKELKSSEFTVK